MSILKTAVERSSPCKVKQAFKSACNINLIIDRFHKTGAVGNVRQSMPQFMSLDPVDLHQSLNLVREAESLFQQVPAHVRDAVGNDMFRFLEFVQNKDNMPALIELGLADKIEDSPLSVVIRDSLGGGDVGEPPVASQATGASSTAPSAPASATPSP